MLRLFLKLVILNVIILPVQFLGALLGLGTGVVGGIMQGRAASKQRKWQEQQAERARQYYDPKIAGAESDYAGTRGRAVGAYTGISERPGYTGEESAGMYLTPEEQEGMQVSPEEAASMYLSPEEKAAMGYSPEEAAAMQYNPEETAGMRMSDRYRAQAEISPEDIAGLERLTGATTGAAATRAQDVLNRRLASQGGYGAGATAAAERIQQEQGRQGAESALSARLQGRELQGQRAMQISATDTAAAQEAARHRTATVADVAAQRAKVGGQVGEQRTRTAGTLAAARTGTAGDIAEQRTGVARDVGLQRMRQQEVGASGLTAMSGQDLSRTMGLEGYRANTVNANTALAGQMPSGTQAFTSAMSNSLAAYGPGGTSGESWRRSPRRPSSALAAEPWNQ